MDFNRKKTIVHTFSPKRIETNMPIYSLMCFKVQTLELLLLFEFLLADYGGEERVNRRHKKSSECEASFQVFAHNIVLRQSRRKNLRIAFEASLNDHLYARPFFVFWNSFGIEYFRSWYSTSFFVISIYCNISADKFLWRIVSFTELNTTCMFCVSTAFVKWW